MPTLHDQPTCPMSAHRPAPHGRYAQRYTTPAEIEAARTQRDARAIVSRARLGGVVRIATMGLVLALALRSLVFEPFTITSPSMQPGLLIGDYLFAAKWPYGYNRYSLPLALPLFDGRWPGGRVPKRGDVVVFKSPADNRTNFIKRVIGLPGDSVALVDGQLVINGVSVARARVDKTSNQTTKYYRETLGERSYTVMYMPHNSALDNYGPVNVPADHYFLLGDNRDNSADSRLALIAGGIGMVPASNLVGRADRVFFSIDSDALRQSPPNWRNVVRTARIGAQF